MDVIEMERKQIIVVRACLAAIVAKEEEKGGMGKARKRSRSSGGCY